MENEIVVPQAKDVAVYSGPTGLADNITSADLHLPRVALLQALSKPVQDDPEHFKQGQFINTLTQELIAEPLVFTPVFVFKNVIAWKPRSEGGGMLWKSMDLNSAKVRDAIAWKGDKKPIADLYYNVVCRIPGQDMPMVMSFCKTSLTAGQNLCTFIQLSGCAWRYQYELRSEKTKNDKGTFYKLRVKQCGESTPEQKTDAAMLYEQVKGMSISTDYEGATEAVSDSVTGAEPQEF